MPKRKYNRKYFSEIDCEEKAYWLGFIAADGSVREKPDACLSIALKEADRTHLELFANALKYDGQIRHQKKSNSCRIDLWGKEMSSDLIAHGIVPHKTHNLKPWNGPTEFMKSYWRGFFDGDGCISSYTRKNGYRQWTVVVIGTQEICDSFVKFVNLSHKHYTTVRSKLHVVQWSSIVPCQKIVRKLYTDSTLHLHRKHLLANEMLQQPVRENIIQATTNRQMLIDLRKEKGSWEQVANFLGVSRNGLYKHIRKLEIPRRSWERQCA
jgi:hypothetical protein